LSFLVWVLLELTTTGAFRGKELFAGSDTTVAFKSFCGVLWSNLYRYVQQDKPIHQM
jgi:hypothetical protein